MEWSDVLSLKVPTDREAERRARLRRIAEQPTTLDAVMARLSELGGDYDMVAFEAVFVPRAADPLVKVQALIGDAEASADVGFMPFDPEYGLNGAMAEIGNRLPKREGMIWEVSFPEPREPDQHRDRINFGYYQVPGSFICGYED